MKRGWLLAPLLLSAPAAAVMDCSRALTNVEKMLCSSDRAAHMEQLMARAFRAAFVRTGNRARLRAEQLQWQESVRDQCTDVPCLVKVYRERIGDLEDIQAAPQN